MKRLKPLSASILIVSALLLNGARSVSAQSKPDPKKHETPSALPANGTYQNNQTALYAALIEALHAVTEQEKATAQEERAQNEALISPPHVQEGLLLVGFLYSVLAWLQWKEIARQATLTERALIANIRPRISIGVLTPNCGWVGHEFQVLYEIKNTGPSPAFVKIHNEMVIITADELPGIPLYGENVPCPDIPGNDKRAALIKSPPVGESIKLPQMMNKTKVYFIVRVVYMDEMGAEHETALCAMYDGRSFLKPPSCPMSYFKNT